jgi:ferritin-like metal-binding protein YciE
MEAAEAAMEAASPAPPTPLPSLEDGEDARLQAADELDGMERLPDVTPVPPEEVAEGAQRRLLRFLSDAHAVEKEQVDLLQNLAESSTDPELRVLLEEHRAASERQQHAIRDRLNALGFEPAGGRSMLNRVVTRVWDALREPSDPLDDTVQGLLKAISAAEFEAGAYVSVYTLARAVGDGETAALATTHLAQERRFAARLRDQMTATVARAARR